MVKIDWNERVRIWNGMKLNGTKKYSVLNILHRNQKPQLKWLKQTFITSSAFEQTKRIKVSRSLKTMFGKPGTKIFQIFLKFYRNFLNKYYSNTKTILF